jgi:adenylate cyclase class IV
MENNSYEIEIKCLLGNSENAKKLSQKMREIDPNLKEIGTHKQLNHYFEGEGDFKKIADFIENENDKSTFLEITSNAKDISLRTRKADETVILVLKASIDDTTSSNGTARREFEKIFQIGIEELDKIIINAGFSYQAKWSRERTEYIFKNVNVTIDKNAGYGYLTEFEIIEKNPELTESRKKELREMIKEVGLEELDQQRLARMFDYYNKNWKDYYGTEKIFIIE